MSLRDALIEAWWIRLRPILMTTIALIGGVITSTFLTLLVIPTFYEIFDGFCAWALGLFSKVFKGAEKWAPTTAKHPVP